MQWLSIQQTNLHSEKMINQQIWITSELKFSNQNEIYNMKHNFNWSSLCMRAVEFKVFITRILCYVSPTISLSRSFFSFFFFQWIFVRPNLMEFNCMACVLQKIHHIMTLSISMCRVIFLNSIFELSKRISYKKGRYRNRTRTWWIFSIFLSLSEILVQLWRRIMRTYKIHYKLIISNEEKEWFVN